MNDQPTTPNIKMIGTNNPNYGKHWTEEQKEAHSKKLTGRVQPLHEKENQIKAMTGRTRDEFSDEWKATLSAAKQGENNNRWGTEHKESSIELMRAKATGRVQSEETKQKKADASRGSKREKKLCPHCGKEVAVNGYARWHGDNCKLNPVNKKD